jgi:hypothetical protein
MAGDKQKYTDAMRHAKGPNQPPGGSTNVNGRIPSTRTRQVIVNIATPNFDDDSEHDDYDSTHEEDDEMILFLSQHYKDEYELSTTYSTNCAHLSSSIWLHE